MELVFIVVCLFSLLIILSLLVFCYKVIHIVDHERIVQHQIKNEDLGIQPATATTYSTPDEINVEDDQPLDQFEPDYTKPLKVKFAEPKDEYTEVVN